MRHRLNKPKALVSRMLVRAGQARPLPGIPVLLYHSVDESGSCISVSTRRFQQQMECLYRHGYRTISLSELVAFLEHDERPPKKTVVITFDDGFKNNYTHAFPVLRKYGFSATIFLTTDLMDSTCSWKKHPSIPEIPLMSWDQVEEMSVSGMDFGSHGCSHAFMTRLSGEEMKKELLASKTAIEEKTGRSADFFCHPYGDTNGRTQEAVRSYGYRGAFGGLDFSLTHNSKETLYDLKRIGTSHFSSLWDFRAGLLGTYDWYIKIKKRLGIKEYEN